MISPMSSAVLTIGVVATERVLTAKPITGRFIIGSGIYLLFLASFYEAAPDVASKLALIVLISTIFVNGESVARKVGMI